MRHCDKSLGLSNSREHMSRCLNSAFCAPYSPPNVAPVSIKRANRTHVKIKCRTVQNLSWRWQIQVRSFEYFPTTDSIIHVVIWPGWRLRLLLLWTHLRLSCAGELRNTLNERYFCHPCVADPAIIDGNYAWRNYEKSIFRVKWNILKIFTSLHLTDF